MCTYIHKYIYKISKSFFKKIFFSFIKGSPLILDLLLVLELCRKGTVLAHVSLINHLSEAQVCRQSS